MSSAILISEFNRVAGPRVRLDKLNLRYQNNGQVIDATGWHADGTPFAFVSQPFDGDPVQRVQQIAADLIRLHTGKPMPTPDTITGLAQKLQEAIAKAHDRSQKMAQDFTDSVSTLHARLDEADKIKADIDKASADIHNALGGGNGGPLDTPQS